MGGSGHDDEAAYLAARNDEWEARQARARGISRRRMVGLLAGAPLVTAAGWAPSPRRAPARPLAPAQAAGPILKPLPPELFVVHGTNAETRWEADRKSTRLNSSHCALSRMPSSA